MFFSTPLVQVLRPIRQAIGFCAVFLSILFLSINSATMSFAATSEPVRQDLGVIRQAAEDFVVSQLPANSELQHQVKAAPLDSRLQFNACASELTSSLPGKQTLTTKATVLVRCPTQNWQVYVPVKILSVSPVIVTARAIRSDTVLQADDLVLTYKDVRQAHSRIFDDLSLLIGAKTVRPLNASAPISAAQICQVCKGDRVVLKAGKPGLAVVASGVAMGNGTIGDTIQIRNHRSQRVVNAVVTRVGEAAVTY
ncbi:flagellar basal body P-ring formation chaperone FlgA [Plesiomonas sp.]|uniref:flagellar basal body P-ring formation chaperone FlgA n=1 Tax=Plesiomonas sp. TaxID=2486279 RepID=UPI003F2F12CA